MSRTFHWKICKIVKQSLLLQATLWKFHFIILNKGPCSKNQPVSVCGAPLVALFAPTPPPVTTCVSPDPSSLTGVGIKDFWKRCGGVPSTSQRKWRAKKTYFIIPSSYQEIAQTDVRSCKTGPFNSYQWKKKDHPLVRSNDGIFWDWKFDSKGISPTKKDAAPSGHRNEILIVSWWDSPIQQLWNPCRG